MYSHYGITLIKYWLLSESMGISKQLLTSTVAFFIFSSSLSEAKKGTAAKSSSSARIRPHLGWDHGYNQFWTSAFPFSYSAYLIEHGAVATELLGSSTLTGEKAIWNMQYVAKWQYSLTLQSVENLRSCTLLLSKTGNQRLYTAQSCVAWIGGESEGRTDALYV